MAGWILPTIQAAAAVYGALKSKTKNTGALALPDISGELAKLDALYGEKRALLTQDIAKQTGQMTRQTAQNLANRGILRSPISEASFAKTRATGQQALSQGLSDLYGQQAGQRSAALNSLLQYNWNVQNANYQRELARQQQAASLRSGLIATGMSYANQIGAGGSGASNAANQATSTPSSNFVSLLPGQTNRYLDTQNMLESLGNYNTKPYRLY